MNHRERILDTTAVGPAMFTPDQTAWRNEKKVWGRTEPDPPQWAMSATTQNDAGSCEYRDLDVSDDGWLDTALDLTSGQLFRTVKP